MISQELVLQAIEDCNKDRTKTLAEFICTIFKDQFVEIYLGDSYEEVSVEQISTSYPAVFVGKVVAAYKECLVLNCIYVNKSTKELELGNMVFISERAIRGLNAVDGKGVLEDMFLRSSESLDIKSQFVDGIRSKLARKLKK